MSVTELAPDMNVAESQEQPRGHHLGRDITTPKSMPGAHGQPLAADMVPPEAKAPPQLQSHHADSEIPSAMSHARQGGIDLTDQLQIASDFLDDVEGLRKATGNRIGALQRNAMEAMGVDLDVTVYQKQHEALLAMEMVLEKQLKLALKHHPLGPWVKRTSGVGAKQGARLIAAIGLVAYNTLEERPRYGHRELWAYCGYVPGQRRTKGQKSNWSALAKSRAFLCAESCLKAKTSPYNALYYEEKTRQEHAVHDAACPQCGPRGKPAQPGSPLSKGHQHARALRKVAKKILEDMFLEAKRLQAELGCPV